MGEQSTLRALVLVQAGCCCQVGEVTPEGLALVLPVRAIEGRISDTERALVELDKLSADGLSADGLVHRAATRATLVASLEMLHNARLLRLEKFR